LAKDAAGKEIIKRGNLPAWGANYFAYHDFHSSLQWGETFVVSILGPEKRRFRSKTEKKGTGF
jgi:hypothetical protein